MPGPSFLTKNDDGIEWVRDPDTDEPVPRVRRDQVAFLDDLGDPLDPDRGSALVAHLQEGAGAVGRALRKKLSEFVSVRDFGACGDGLSDDTAAIQSAIDAVRARQNGELHFPPREPGQYYRITRPLVVRGPITLRGAGPDATQIIGTGLRQGQYLLDFDCAAGDGVEHVHLTGLTLRSTDGAPCGLRLKNVAYVLAKDLRIFGVEHGIVLEGTRCFTGSFENINTYAISNSAVRFQRSFSGGGQFNFLGCTFMGANGFVLDGTSFTDSLCFNGCNFEQCKINSVYIGGSCRALAFLGCRTEGCDSDDFQINPVAGRKVEGLVISGCSFTSDTALSKPVILGGAGGKVRGFSITGNQVEYAAAGSAFVYLNGDGESGLIAGNSFAQVDTQPTNTPRAGVVVFGNENAKGKCAEYWGQADWGVAQGNWTPVDASGAGLKFARASGRYTRIGRTVQWQAMVEYPATGSTAAAAVGGLPLPVGGLGGAGAGRAGGRVDVSNFGAALGLMQGAGPGGSLVPCDPHTGVATTNAALATKWLLCSGSYTL